LIPELAFYCYRLFGRRLKGLSSRLTELDAALKRSDIRLSTDAYVSFIVFVSVIVLFASALDGFVISYSLTKSLAFATLAAPSLGLTGFVVTSALLYTYPLLKAGKRKKAVDESLPYAVSFMGILSSAGVPPSRIFRALAVLEQEEQMGLGGEARTIYRDMEALGEDLISVLKEVSSRKVSASFSSLVEGMISTIRLGGDLTSFLQEEGRSLMRMRRGIMKEFLNTMTIMSEMFMAVMVAFPMLLIVMLVVMSAIGGGAAGGVDPEVIVPVLIYGLIPLSGLLILIMIDSVTPR